MKATVDGAAIEVGEGRTCWCSTPPRIEPSRASYRKMKQNLWWAAGYNFVSVPLAAGILAPIGFVPPMSIGAVLTSASTIVVALNAQLLRRLDLVPEASIERILGRA